MGSSDSNVSDTYASLAAAFSGSLTWEWDERFSGVLAAFEANDQDRMLRIIGDQLTHAWNNTNIGDAPDSVNDAIQLFGGLHPGQLLFSSDFTQDVILLGLWWPWDNGATISIRLVPYCKKLDSEKEGLQNALKGAFGL